MSTNSKKLSKTSPLADAVAGTPSTPSESTPPNSTTPKNQRKTTKAASPKTSSSRTVEAIKSGARSQAKADAAAILRIGEQVYAHELEKELRSLMGGETSDYFRAPIESWTLPYTADTEQLAAVEVAALPSKS